MDSSHRVEWYMMAGGLVAFAMIIVLSFFFILPFWFLWNWLVPNIFGLPSITLLESIGLFFLIRIILFQYNYTDTKEINK